MRTLYKRDPCILHILTSKENLKNNSNNFHFPTLPFYPFLPPKGKKNTQ